MKPPCCGAAAPSPWADIEGFGDCFENVLAHLEPADVAACRLVSRNWRRATGLLLQQLQPAAGVQPEQVAATFPHVSLLQLTAKPSGSPRGSDSSGALFGRPAGAAGAAGEAGGLPPLGGLPRLRRLRRLKLQGALLAGSALDCAELAHLAGMPALDELEAACLELHNAAALQQLGAQLTRLHLQGHSLPGGQGGLPALLAPLRRLAHLHFSCFARFSGSGRGGGGGPSSGSNPFGSAGQLEGLGRLTSLVTLELSSSDASSDAVCWEVAAGPLPRLRRLAIHRCASFGYAAPTIGDSGVELLAARLGGQLTSLVSGRGRRSCICVPAVQLAGTQVLRHCCSCPARCLLLACHACSHVRSVPPMLSLSNPCPPRSLPQQALSGLARISNVGVEAIAGMGQLQQLELRLGGPQAVHW